MTPLPTTDNPFSAGRLRPGAIGFLFEDGQSLEQCLARLGRHRGWGQILGPHGSGKSALFQELTSYLREQGVRVEEFTLHAGQRRLPPISSVHERSDPRQQLAIDGFEQLSSISRWRVKRMCRRRGNGLLVTTHRDLGLPDVFVTHPTPEMARLVVHRFMEGRPDLITLQDVDRCFDASRGNLRETLFSLYDLFEKRRAGG